MTRMLAGVSGPEEAIIALAAGVDIIDLTNPSHGPLGAVAPELVRQTVAAVAGRRPVSAAAGNGDTGPGAVLAAAETGATLVRIGIFPKENFEPTIRALGAVAAKVKLIAVLFADRAPDFALLPSLASAGFAGAMLDTADKSPGRLLDAMDLPRLRRFLAACRAVGLKGGLAGALEAPDVSRLLVLAPDVLGFRRALCGPGGRTAPISAASVRAIRGLIPPATLRDAPDSPRNPLHTDRVFLRELVLPAFIGAYSSERETPQRLRFDVEALVQRSASRSPDLGDVFSYDVIGDGIRMLVDAGHIVLVETLAEGIAALMLAHPRVVQVSVRVAKLDLPGGIGGIAIERTRQTVAALADLFPGLAS